MIWILMTALMLAANVLANAAIPLWLVFLPLMIVGAFWAVAAFGILAAFVAALFTD